MPFPHLPHPAWLLLALATAAGDLSDVHLAGGALVRGFVVKEMAGEPFAAYDKDQPSNGHRDLRPPRKGDKGD